MGFYNCTTCGCRVSYTDGDRPNRNTCFRCHVKTLSIGFTYGKENFHGDTIRERQQQRERDARAAGVDIAPVGSRWV